MGGAVRVSVTVNDGAITAVEVLEHKETPGISDPALEKLPAAVGWAWSFLTVLVGWSIFYFVDFDRLLAFLPVLLGGRVAPDPGLGVTVQNNLFWILLSAAFCAPVLPWLGRLTDRFATGERRQAAVVAFQAAACLLLVMVSTAYLVGQSYNPFLYFRF